MAEEFQIKKTKDKKYLDEIIILNESVKNFREKAEFKDILYSKNSYVWAAFLNKDLVGYAVARSKRNALECNWIYVKPDYRRKGIASEIKKQQVLFAKDKEFRDLYSYVESKDALRVWEKQKRLGYNVEKSGNFEGYDVWIRF